MEPMDRIKETISSVMGREAELFVFFLLNELNKYIEAHVKKKGAEAIPLKDTPANGDSRGSKAINNNESLKVVIKTRYQYLYSK